MVALGAYDGGLESDALRRLADKFDHHAHLVDNLIRPVADACRGSAQWRGPHRERFDRDVTTWARRHGDAARQLRATAVVLRRRALALEDALREAGEKRRVAEREGPQPAASPGYRPQPR